LPILTMWLFQICSFPNGADFCGRVNLRPDQHIYRRANPSWVPDRPDRPRRGNRPPLPPQPLATISKFRVRRYLHNNCEYWSPYDLLGLFLSLMGSAPAGATKRNFYLPMTAVYGRWCRQIAGSLPHNGICDIPFMFQCTWCIPSGDSGQPTRFVTPRPARNTRTSSGVRGRTGYVSGQNLSNSRRPKYWPPSSTPVQFASL
jgi:hypothetical protein